MPRRYKSNRKKVKKSRLSNKSNCGCMKLKKGKTSMRSKRRNSNQNIQLPIALGRKLKQLSRKNLKQTRGSRRYRSRSQRGGFFTDPEQTRACRGPSSIDMNSADFQSMFNEPEPESSELTLDDMQYCCNNSEGRPRYSPL